MCQHGSRALIVMRKKFSDFAPSVICGENGMNPNKETNLY